MRQGTSANDDEDPDYAVIDRGSVQAPLPGEGVMAGRAGSPEADLDPAEAAARQASRAFGRGLAPAVADLSRRVADETGIYIR